MLTCLWASAARAQTGGPSEGQLRAARALADAGYELFKAGKYDESYERFKSAEAIYHAPPHVLFMAQSAAKLGRVVEARELFKSLIEEELPQSSPKPFFKAKETAAAEIKEVEARVATLRVTVKGPKDAPTVVIDGVNRSRQVAAGPVDLDPGEHRVRVTAQGFELAEKAVTLKEGERDVPLAIELTLLPADKPKDKPGDKPKADVVIEDGPLWPGLVTAGVGLAGIGVGVAMGVLAMQKADELHAACPVREQCAPENEELESDALLFGNISTGAFIGGGVIAATSVVLLILRPGGGPVEPDEAAASITPLIAPGYIGVRGTF